MIIRLVNCLQVGFRHHNEVSPRMMSLHHDRGTKSTRRQRNHAIRGMKQGEREKGTKTIRYIYYMRIADHTQGKGRAQQCEKRGTCKKERKRKG